MDKIGDTIKITKTWYSERLSKELQTGVHKITYVYGEGNIQVTLKDGSKWTLNRRCFADWKTVGVDGDISIYEEVG